MEGFLKCVLCKRESRRGIGILGKFVCDDCEEALINLDMQDDRYDMYKDLIKKNVYGDFIIK